MISTRRVAMAAAERVVRRISRRRIAIDGRANRRRGRRLQARLRLRAAWVGATIDVEFGEHLIIGRHISVFVAPGTHNVLRVGDYCEIDDLVRLQLKGGEIHLAQGAQLRRGATLNVSGRLDVGEQVILSWFAVVHCAQEVVVGRRATISEFATIVDSTHFVSDDDWTVGNVAPGRVAIGENSWIAAKATVTRNVTIGAQSIVSASAVVLDDVPAGHVASGVPAQSRPLPNVGPLVEDDAAAQRPSSSP